jgi:hypothetical protein
MRQSQPARSQLRFLGPLVLVALSVLALCLSAAAGAASSAATVPGPARHPAHVPAASNLGKATHATALAATTVSGLPAGGVLGDVTGDGLADILAIDPAGNLWLYPNSGVGGVNMFDTARSQVGSGWTGYTLAAVAPLYGATRAGLLAIDQAGNLWYYPNTGGSGLSTFGPPSVVGIFWMDWTVVGVTDLYGTGAPGILAIAGAGNRGSAIPGYLFYYPNIGGTGLDTFGLGYMIGSGWTGHTADVADINGDGKPDILAVDSAGNLWLYPNAGGTGISTFGARSQVGSGWSGWQAIVAGQLTSTGPASILGIDPAGDLWYYPNTGGTGKSTFGSPIKVGTGWTGFRIN